MGRFNIVPQDAFNSLELEAGILLSNFNPRTPNIQDYEIICATTGGVNVSCVPIYADQCEDIEYCVNIKEFQKLIGWECKLTTTCIRFTVDTIERALSAYTLSSPTGYKIITPRATLNLSDYKTAIWWVGDRADGGLVAVELRNALSMSGAVIQTAKKSKGRMTFEFKGFSPLASPTDAPIRFYIADPK